MSDTSDDQGPQWIYRLAYPHRWFYLVTFALVLALAGTMTVTGLNRPSPTYDSGLGPHNFPELAGAVLWLAGASLLARAADLWPSGKPRIEREGETVVVRSQWWRQPVVDFYYAMIGVTLVGLMTLGAAHHSDKRAHSHMVALVVVAVLFAGAAIVFRPHDRVLTLSSDGVRLRVGRLQERIAWAEVVGINPVNPKNGQVMSMRGMNSGLSFTTAGSGGLPGSKMITLTWLSVDPNTVMNAIYAVAEHPEVRVLLTEGRPEPLFTSPGRAALDRMSVGDIWEPWGQSVAETMREVEKAQLTRPRWA